MCQASFNILKFLQTFFFSNKYGKAGESIKTVCIPLMTQQDTKHGLFKIEIAHFKKLGNKLNNICIIFAAHNKKITHFKKVDNILYIMYIVFVACNNSNF